MSNDIGMVKYTTGSIYTAWAYTAGKGTETVLRAGSAMEESLKQKDKLKKKKKTILDNLKSMISFM